MTLESSHWKRWLLASAVGLLVVGLIGGVTIYEKLFREEPLAYRDDADHFKYGSIGTEKGGLALPYWIWLVMPRLFPEYLPGPGGYASLGFSWEEGHETPIGLTKKVVGQPMVGINCALCHTASMREDKFHRPKFYLTGPAHTFDTQGYFRFLFNCASDPRFTADYILPEIKANYRLSFTDELLYRYVLIPATKKGLLGFKAEMAFMEKQPSWARGRIDPFNPAKFRYVGLPVDTTIGHADNMQIWGMKQHLDNKYVFHWDGLLHGPLEDVVNTSALGDSVLPKSMPVDDLSRLQRWLLEQRAPPYPWDVDKALAAEGEKVWKQACASCHAVGGARTGQVIPQAEVGTDDHRMKSWSQEAADKYIAFGQRYGWSFHFQKVDGYAAVPLDGIWLRGPYLHNGAVPSLVELLEPVEKRPAVFYRGYDVFDREKVGFVSQGEDAKRFGSRVDTREPGSSNAGHTYGTELSPESKRALVEYLKTL